MAWKIENISDSEVEGIRIALKNSDTAHLLEITKKYNVASCGKCSDVKVLKQVYFVALKSYWKYEISTGYFEKKQID